MYNIFEPKKKSKKNLKIKKIPKKKIVIDFRERNSLVPSELIKRNLSLEFKQLKVADYLINEIAIERKSVRDFIQSILDKRIFHQIEEIKQYPKPLLIIEGNLQQETKIHPNAIKGMILSVTLNYQVPIIFTKNEEETANYISLIANKKSKEISLNPKKRTIDKNQQLQFILESFPNIGPIKAKKLLKEFKNLKGIFTTSGKNLVKILGKKSKEFKEIINYKFSK